MKHAFWFNPLALVARHNVEDTKCALLHFSLRRIIKALLVKCLGNTAVELPFESELVWGVRFWLSVTCGYRGVRFTVG